MGINDRPHVRRVEWEGLQHEWEFDSVEETEALPKGAEKVTVRRGDYYKIEGEIIGRGYDSREDFRAEGRIGSFIPKFDLRGSRYEGLIEYELSDCYIGEVHLEMMDRFTDPSAQKFKIDLSASRAKVMGRETSEEGWLTEWYLNGPPQMERLFVFPRWTWRKYKEQYIRRRESVDNDDVIFEEEVPPTGSHDCAFIRTKYLSFAIQVVPETLTPQWTTGLGIEYRHEWGGIPEPPVREAISEIVGFVFGRPLVGVGFTRFDLNGDPVEQETREPTSTNLTMLCNSGGYPPVRLLKNTHHEGDEPVRESSVLEPALESLVPAYMDLRGELRLHHALVLYRLFTEVPVGVNLPILAAGVESIARSWLRSPRSRSRGVYLAKERFESLTESGFKSIEGNLDGEEYKDRVMGRLRNAYQMSINDQMKVFLQEVGLPVGEVEWEAIGERNVMAHGASKVFEVSRSEEMIVLTHAYRTFFNRILLKILGYDGLYVDYTCMDHPNKHIDQPLDGTLRE